MNPDEHDPNDPTKQPPPDSDDGGGDDGDDEGGDEGPGDGGGAAEAMPQGQPGQPGQPGQGGGRRRRRRRRRKGNPVLFTPDGQAYRMVTQPDGQQSQVFLTPQEVEQYKQRIAQQQLQQHQRNQPQGPRRPAGPPPGPVNVVEGVLDTDVKGPNAYLRQLKNNLLANPDRPRDPEEPGAEAAAAAGPVPHRARRRCAAKRGQVQRVDTVEGMPLDAATRLPHFQDLTSIDPIERIKLENQPQGDASPACST